MPRSSRISAPRAALSLAAAALFLWLARAVSRGATAAWDAQVRARLHAHASAALTGLAIALTQLGEAWFLVPFCCGAAALLARSGRRRAAILFGVCAAGAAALDQLLKLFFHRVRPAAFFGLASPANYSFPSGHALASVAIYGMLAAILAARLPRPAARGALCTAAALLIVSVGMTRVYLGVHWPSDVLGGFLAGLAWLLALPAVSHNRSLN